MSDQKQGGGKLKEAAWHSLIYGLGSLAQSALGFVLLPLLTGALSKNDFGTYSLILMASTVASAVFFLGMTSALPRSYFDYQNPDERRGVFTTAFLILALGALLQTMLGYWGGSLLSTLLVRQASHGDAVFWAFLSGALVFVNQYFYTYLRLLRSSIAVVSFSLLGLVLGIGLTLWLLDMHPGSIAAPFQATAYSQLLITAIFLGTYGRKAFTWKIQYAEIKLLFHFGFATILTSFGNMILDWADRIIIERYMTLAEVGMYSASVRVSALVSVLLVIPFTQIWSPMMMEYRCDANIKALFSGVFSYFLIIGGVVLAGAAFFFPEVLPILIRYESTPTMVVIFLLVGMANLIYGSTNIVAAGIFYERKIYLLACIYYAVAGLKLAINFIFIPMFGIGAAAMATLFTSILLPTVIYSLGKKYFSFPIEWKRILTLLCVLVLPLGYAFLSVAHILPQTGFILRLAMMLVTMALVFKLCLTTAERGQLQHFLAKLRKR